MPQQGKTMIMSSLVKMGKKTESKKPAARKSKKAAVVAVTAEPAAPLIPLPAEVKPAKKTLKNPAARAVPSFTKDDVALRAYFKAERRRKLGLPGDECQDWIDSERELLAEAKRKPAAGKKKKT
jgi:hypothetical protein